MYLRREYLNVGVTRLNLMIIGLDDTDSKESMCTTYLAAVLIGKLKSYGTIEGYPWLVRLNPNIKYKTRGNAAIAIKLEINRSEEHIIQCSFFC